MAGERRGDRPLELSAFRQDVVAGLSAPRKCLPPKYFYDAAGSRLFARITRLSEYYVTRAELALTRRHLAAIARFAGRGCQLIEYGTGEGVKSRLLIRALRPSVYAPIDISQDALDAAARRLAREFPKLRIRPIVGDFSRPLDIPVRRTRGAPSVVYLVMSRGFAHGMLVGVDLKKDPTLLHAAYNDSRGVTAAFNLNLLARINRELGADFDLRRWRHYAFYNPAEGRIEMHLVSMTKQRITLGKHRFQFAAGETIHSENSYKYSIDGFRELAAAAGFETRKSWTDSRGLFALHGLERS